MKTRIVSIVLNWQQPQLTINTVSDLLATSCPDFNHHILIVDNNSSDDSLTQFSDKFINTAVTTIKTDSNLGYSGGNNFGIKYAIKHFRPSHILIINNDVHTDIYFLDRLYQAINSDPKIGIVGPKIYFASGHEYHQDRYSKSDKGKVIWSVGGQIDWNNISGQNIGIDQVDDTHFSKIVDVDFVPGCCLLIRTELIIKLGELFDERYFMYMEDVDLSHRSHLAGYRTIVNPKSVIWHINAGSSSVGSPLADYFLTRNRLIFGFKYASVRTKIALARHSLNLFLQTKSKWQKQAIIDFYMLRFGKGSWQ